MEQYEVNTDSEKFRQNGVEISFVEEKKNVVVENEGRKYYRSEVRIVIDSRALELQKSERAKEVLSKFEDYSFSVWSEQPIEDVSAVIERMQHEGVFIGECGLASNPGQFDNESCSTVVSLNEIAEEHNVEKKLFVAFSCPGFGGSKLKDSEVNEQNVGVESYLQVNNFILDTLGVNTNQSVLIGHSAGGEKALGMTNRIRVVALNPAVHLDVDEVFGGKLSFPNSVAKFWRRGLTSRVVDSIAGGVVKYMVGAKETILSKSENIAMNSQVANHLEEIKNNFKAYIAKSNELIEIDKIAEYSGNPMAVVGGNADSLTPWNKASEYLQNMLHGYQSVQLMTEDNFGVDKIHHDTVFMNKQLNKGVALLAWDLLNQPMVTDDTLNKPEGAISMSTNVEFAKRERTEAKEYDIKQERLDLLFRWEMFGLESKGWIDLFNSHSDQIPSNGDFVSSFEKWILSYEPVAEIVSTLKTSEIGPMMEELLHDKVYRQKSYPMFSFDVGMGDRYQSISKMIEFRHGLVLLSNSYSDIKSHIEMDGDYADKPMGIGPVSYITHMILPLLETDDNGENAVDIAIRLLK